MWKRIYYPGRKHLERVHAAADAEYFGHEVDVAAAEQES